MRLFLRVLKMTVFFVYLSDVLLYCKSYIIFYSRYLLDSQVKTYARALAFGVLGKFVSAHVCCDTGLGQAYFGNGTKLTVLSKKNLVFMQ